MSDRTPGWDDYSLEQMREMQRQYLRAGGSAMPAMGKLPPYEYAEYPKWVRKDGVELGIAETPEQERVMLARAAPPEPPPERKRP